MKFEVGDYIAAIKKVMVDGNTYDPIHTYEVVEKVSIYGQIHYWLQDAFDEYFCIDEPSSINFSRSLQSQIGESTIN